MLLYEKILRCFDTVRWVTEKASIQQLLKVVLWGMLGLTGSDLKNTRPATPATVKLQTYFN